ncbi:MAG: PAS domain S-box protein [Geobacter sp.]|nr:PAS domain S-box protein [Geobacter sp.]
MTMPAVVPNSCNALLKMVLEGTSTAVGEAYLHTLCTTLTDVFKVRYVVIGRLLPEQQLIRTLRVYADGVCQENITYPLAGTPCEQVVGIAPRYFPANTAELFPEDKLLEQLEISCYLGVPLYSSAGQALGNLLLMDSTPLPDENVPVALQLLELLALRTAGEIERLEREQQLALQEIHYGILLNSSSDGLLTTDTQARITSVNKAYCSMMGYEPAELVGRHISELEANETPEEVAEHTALLLARGFDRFISRHRRKDGTCVDLELTLSVSPETGRVLTIARDMTEQLALEKQLQDSEQRYHIFTELSSDFCHVCTRSNDGPFRVQWVGGNFELITGYRTDELLAIGCWLPLVHPDDRERVGTDLLRMQAGDELRSEFRLIRKDQTVLWIRERSRCVAHPEDPAGLVLYGSARNITRLLEQSRALEAAEAAYRTIFNSVNDAIFVQRPEDGMVLDANRRASELYGFTRTELIGKTQDDLTYASDDKLRQLAHKQLQLAESGTPHAFEWPARRADGTLLWVEVNLRATLINERPRILAVVRDITERKEITKRLEESEQRFRALAEQIPCLPVQGYDRNREVIFWNEASSQLYGFSKEEALGRKLEDLIIPPFMRETVIQGVQNWLEGGTAIPAGELELLCKDGSLVPVFSSHARLINVHGEPEMYCIDVDLTEQRRTTRLLEEARSAADAANRAKNEFLANMSHEVRTPLNGIMGLSQLLRTTALNQEQNEYLDMLDCSSRNLLLLINDILDISRIEAGSLRLEETPFSPESLLQEVHSIYEKVADEKGITLQCIIADRLPQALLGDPLRLKQVLINLIGNAIKFTSHGGVTLTVRCAGVESGQIRLAFVVEDSGIGMSAETLQKVFNPFTQADSSTARIHGGSGLGLAICRRLTELMQGSITATSSLGHGSSFTVELPFGICSLAMEPELPVAAATELLLPGLQILLVEDQEVNRTFVQRQLERQGQLVTPAVDGLMALDLLERNRYDLMLLDIQMPGMGGEEVLARLRTAEAVSSGHLPVIALTAHALAGDRELLLASGFDGYVAKPVQMELLQTEMLRVLQQVSEQGNQV